MKIVRTHGIDDIWQRYKQSFVVELDEQLPCGKPIAFKMTPLKPIALFAMGEGWLIQGTGGKTTFTDEDYQRMLKVCAKCVTAIREWEEDEQGALTERWTPVTVVIGREPKPDAIPREIAADFLDFNLTLTVLTNELIRRFQLQWSTRGDGGSRIQPEGPGGHSGNGGDVQHHAARVGIRRKRRARS